MKICALLWQQVARDRDWHGAAHRQGACVKKALPPCLVAEPGPPVGRARKKRKLIQAPSPETWSETISGSEKFWRGKWGAVFGLPPWKKYVRRDRAHLIPPNV